MDCFRLLVFRWWKQIALRFTARTIIAVAALTVYGHFCQRRHVNCVFYKRAVILERLLLVHPCDKGSMRRACSGGLNQSLAGQLQFFVDVF